MSWFPNPLRIRELFDEEKVRLAAKTILSFRNREMLMLLLNFWGIALGMVFTLLLTIRLALTIPLF